MKNIIEAVSIKKFMEHIEVGISVLQDQDLPVNPYTFSFVVSELNKYIEELEHPRYIPFICGGIVNGVMDIDVQISDRFNQNSWIGNVKFSYPRSGEITKELLPPVVKSFGGIVPAEPRKPTIVPVPRVDVFDSEVKTGSRTKGYTKNMSTTVHRKRVGLKFSSYTEYVNYVAAIFDELAGCTDCLNKTLIDAFLGRFSYPEAFVAAGTTTRQHLKLRDDIELNDEVKAQFQIDWDYFLNNWDDNAITIAQYKSVDAQRTYKGKHKSIDLIEQRVGMGTFALTDFGKVIWEKVHDLLGLLPEDDIVDNDADPTMDEGTDNELPVETSEPAPAVEEDTTTAEEEAQPTPVVKEQVKSHMSFEKCSGCTFFDTKLQRCNKRNDYIINLEKSDCFEEAEVKLEVAPKEEVERICFNCKRWHSGNNPGNLKAIACRCPIMGKKTLTDHTCNKFVAIVKKED